MKMMNNISLIPDFTAVRLMLALVTKGSGIESILIFKIPSQTVE